MRHTLTHPRVLVALLLALVTGCATGKSDGWKFTRLPSPKSLMPDGESDEPQPPQLPSRLVSTWQDAVLTQVGKKAQRGFGGRILFFNQTSEDPIRVDGQLVVYAYDENDRPAHETHPTRRYVFPPEQFARHESECKLGPSYSVWLPWDETGGEQKNISLIARFEPVDGSRIVGDQTRHLLPGTRQLATGESAPPVKPVSDIKLTEYTQTSKIQPPSKPIAAPSRNVTSIALSTEQWKQRLAFATAQASESATEPSESAPSTTSTDPAQ